MNKENIIRELKFASAYLNNKVEHEPDTYDESDVEVFSNIADLCVQAKKALEKAIILPCPIGTTLYQIQMNTRRDGKTKSFHKIMCTKFTYNNFPKVIKDFNTKYFLTRKDAELAAKGE